MSHWTILTCEYPPDCGGVGDYTAQVAGALAADGDRVTVVCPPRESLSAPAAIAGTNVVVLDDAYGRTGRRTLEAMLEADPSMPSTILVQYVPTGFGMRGANIPFCRWLLARARERKQDVRVMFHEPYFEFTWSPLRQNALAAAERVMAKTLLRAASRVYLSTDAWRPYLAPLATAAASDGFVTLPIPSAIPRCQNPEAVTEYRRQFLGSAGRLVGHFGTFGSHIAPMLERAVIALLERRADLSIVLAGSGSDIFVQQLFARSPHVGTRVHGTGRLPAPDLAAALSACDVLLQPYLDGVTTRRTSTMAGLINGRPIVTTTGHLTESVWSDTEAVALADVGDADALVERVLSLLDSDGDRARLAARGETIYRERFALSHTIRALRGVVAGAAA